jgi:hypothetical protein
LHLLLHVSAAVPVLGAEHSNTTNLTASVCTLSLLYLLHLLLIVPGRACRYQFWALRVCLGMFESGAFPGMCE